MPCRCDYMEYNEPRHPKIKTRDVEAQKQIESLKNELKKLGTKYNSLKAECDRVTQLLCYSCGTFLTTSHVQVDERLNKWWEEHCDWDNRRTLDTFKQKWGTNPDQIPSREFIYNWFVKSAEEIHPLSRYHRTDFFDYIWGEFVEWHNSRKTRADRIAELEAELAKLKAEC